MVPAKKQYHTTAVRRTIGLI